MLSHIWEIVNLAQTNILVGNDENCEDEFNYCWTLQTRNKRSKAEYFEILSLLASIPVIFEIYYEDIDFYYSRLDFYIIRFILFYTDCPFIINSEGD